MAFENRAEAGQMLARRLANYRGRHPLVLAIPRGAVPMGKIVADALDGELDVVLVRKPRAPQNPELAIGSIDEIGAIYLAPGSRDLWDELYL
jgi:putative phosphoribosyl transferase